MLSQHAQTKILMITRSEMSESYLALAKAIRALDQDA